MKYLSLNFHISCNQSEREPLFPSPKHCYCVEDIQSSFVDRTNSLGHVETIFTELIRIERSFSPSSVQCKNDTSLLSAADLT